MAVYMIYKYSKRFRFAPSFNDSYIHTSTLCTVLHTADQIMKTYLAGYRPTSTLYYAANPILGTSCQGW